MGICHIPVLTFILQGILTLETGFSLKNSDAFISTNLVKISFVFKLSVPST